MICVSYSWILKLKSYMCAGISNGSSVKHRESLFSGKVG